MALRNAGKVWGVRPAADATNTVTGNAVLLDEQLPPKVGAGNQVHTGVVRAHLLAGERQHIKGQRPRLLVREVEVGHGRIGR